MMEFNWVDWVVVVGIFVFSWQGLEKSISEVWSELFGFGLGVLVGRGLYSWILRQIWWIQIDKEAMEVLVFVGILILVWWWSYRLLRVPLEKITKQYYSRFWQMIFGVFPSLVMGLGIMGIMVYGLGKFHPWKEIVDEVDASISYGVVVKFENWWLANESIWLKN